MKSEEQDNRRFRRFTVDVMEINSKLILANEVEILDVSLGGVSVRADRRLNIGNEYTLKMEDRAKSISLKGTVVWSILSDVRKGPGGEMIPIYTAGMKFMDMSDERAAALTDFIEGHKEGYFQQNEMYELGDLRLNIRFNINAPERAVLDCPESYKVKKLSLSGMLIESSKELEVEGRFPMEVSFPDETLVTFNGRVASCLVTKDAEDKNFDVGIEFTEMSKKDAKRLKEFIGMLQKMDNRPSRS